jgi:hypothetical protein
MGDDNVLHQYVDFYNLYVKEILIEQNTYLYRRSLIDHKSR